MLLKSKWISPLVATSCLFSAGLILGLAMPFTLQASNLSILLALVTAFSTLALAIVAVFGFNQWRIQQSTGTRVQRAEKALSVLFSVNTLTSPIKSHIRTLKLYRRRVDGVSLSAQDLNQAIQTGDRMLDCINKLRDGLEQISPELCWFSEELNPCLDKIHEFIEELFCSTALVYDIHGSTQIYDLKYEQIIDKAATDSQLPIENISIELAKGMKKMQVLADAANS